MCVFLGTHPQQKEVPRLGVESKIQLPAYGTATAMPDPNHICDPHQRQCWILNPLSKARDLMDTIRFVSSDPQWELTYFSFISLVLCFLSYFYIKHKMYNKHNKGKSLSSLIWLLRTSHLWVVSKFISNLYGLELLSSYLFRLASISTVLWYSDHTLMFFPYSSSFCCFHSDRRVSYGSMNLFLMISEQSSVKAYAVYKCVHFPWRMQSSAIHCWSPCDNYFCHQHFLRGADTWGITFYILHCFVLIQVRWSMPE